MSDKNQSHCKYGDELVAYLYNEIDARDKAVFESHLTKCATCADDLAEFSYARFAVEDWREAEFKHLSTPVFEFPQTEKRSREIVAVKSGSKILEWLRVFTAAPVWATGAAALVITIGLIIAASNFVQPDLVAENNSSKDVSPQATQTIEKSPINTATEFKNQKNSVEQTTAASDKNNNSAIEKSASRNIAAEKGKNALVKVAAHPPKTKRSSVNSENLTATNVKNSDKAARKNSPETPRRVPTLNSFEDDEDNTLRLAELFEQVDSGE